MRVLLVLRRETLVLALMASAFLAGLALGAWEGERPDITAAGLPQVNPKVAAVEMLRQRFETLLDGNTERLRDNYVVETISGEWAWEKELARVEYLRKWLSERGLALSGASAWFEIDDASSYRPGRFRLEITEHAVYQYVRSGVAPVAASMPVHRSGSRTVHVLEVVWGNAGWRIEYDWYIDPLGEAPGEPARGAVPIDSAPKGSGTGPSSLDERSADAPPSGGTTARRYDREKAVAYAVAHSGVRSVPGGGRYNRAYQVYSYEGGDCANFVSQVLSAGSVTQGYGWFHDREGSVSWTCSDELVWYLLASGRGERVFRGSFAAAVQPSEGSLRGPVGFLQPGDVIAYEPGGEIKHVAVVTGFDPSGWPVIASHTADRLFFPWDLGWGSRTVFWFIHVVY
jgi:hypothetical protein